jgi:hypothetical protein
VQPLGIENHLKTIDSNELADIIEQVDAVVTTPSTAMLEAMILKRPVAVLDYHNVPRFVPTAFTISAQEHIPQVITELLHPPMRKIAYQEDTLHECLVCDSSSSSRVAQLIERMISVARESTKGNRWHLPSNMLHTAPDSSGHRQPSLAALYPSQPLFSENDVTLLQVRLTRLQKKNEELTRVVRSRGIRRGIYTFGRHLATYLKPNK